MPSDTPTALIVDDDDITLMTVEKFVTFQGLKAVTAPDGPTGLAILQSQGADLLITDLEMPAMNGIQVIEEAKRVAPDVMTLIMTGHSSIETAVQAMKLGALDYVEKPINFDYLGLVLKRVLEQRRLVSENQRLHAELDGRYSFENIIGRSEAMQKVFATIEKVAPTDANVLISGESGTGKELVARAIHANSRRKDRDFVAVDCVSLPAQLIESELFGHEKGSFTGATERRVGLLELAESGTFFMDEVTEMDHELQAKLLRVLQERQFRRVGGRDLMNVDIRVLSATKRDPEVAVTEGRFREDLFFRLNVIPIRLPALRERREDIPLLVEHFLQAVGLGEHAAKSIHPRALETLQGYAWPGNVRQLQNLVQRLSILADGDEIGEDDIPADFRGALKPDSSSEWMTALPFKEAKDRYVQTFEKAYLEQVLSKYQGNISRAARASGVNRKTFHRLISKHGLVSRNGLDAE